MLQLASIPYCCLYLAIYRILNLFCCFAALRRTLLNPPLLLDFGILNMFNHLQENQVICMGSFHPTFATVTELGDFGPWISTAVLELPAPVRDADLDPVPFNVYVERHETSGGILMRTERGADRAVPSRSYLPVLNAYPCDAAGHRLPEGGHVALVLPECRLTKTIEGTVMQGRFVEHRFRITQTAPLPGEPDPTCGLVYTERTERLCPALTGWHEARMAQAVNGIQLSYGFFEPDFNQGEAPAGPFKRQVQKPERAALIVWLHGAGEGGDEVERAYTGNRVTALSQEKIQGYFGGAAWVVVPQCPTFWMDDGVEQLGRSNVSIYSEPLKVLIDEFITAHADRVDTSRIIIGGLSNGGFMTVRMCADHPDFFAAGVPVCAPFFDENQTPKVIGALAKTPLWFVHAKGDEAVNPAETVLPLYHRLHEVEAPVHLTYFDHVEDLTGRYREADGAPKQVFSHGVWIHVYNDFCRAELDGTNVMLDGEPVGLWEWTAHQRR